MKFDQELPIYIQIENFVKDKILLNIWKADERMPSVREMATTLEVNPNTVMRTYEKLQSKGILSLQRGLGFNVAPNAIKIIRLEKMQKFISELPEFFLTMKLLEIPIETVVSEYNKFIKE